MMTKSEASELERVDRPSGNRRRKVLAILAGGLILGIGAAVTLAVWNDSEFATGTFGSGEFDLEGSLNGTAFSSSPAAPGKALVFAVDANLLAPNDVVYAPFAVQLSATSSYSASVELSNVTSGPLGAQLTYSLYDVGTFGATCSAGSPPTGTPIVANRAATATGVVPAFPLTAAATPVNLCFVVTAGATIPQGENATVTWNFAGTSVAPLP